MPGSSEEAVAQGGAPKPSLGIRWLRAFGRFWWDFLVGDTPELTLSVVAILGVTALLAHAVSSTVAWVLLPALVLAALVLSLWRGRAD
jgi:hypothetical protein